MAGAAQLDVLPYLAGAAQLDVLPYLAGAAQLDLLPYLAGAAQLDRLGARRALHALLAPLGGSDRGQSGTSGGHRLPCR